MPRLLILWGRPHHLSAGEADRWARAEVRGLLADEAIRSAELVRLTSASLRLRCDWDWLLELDVRAPAQDVVERGACAGWLADLRLLGMRPAVMLVDDDAEGG